MLSDFLDKFSDYLRHQRGLSANTVITYRHHTRSYLRFLAKEGIAVAEIEKDSVHNFIESLRRQNKRSATLFVTHIALRTFHEFHCASKVLTDNPMIGLILPKIQSRVPEPLELEQIDRLLSASSARSLLDLRDRAIAEFLFCGLRINEALSLNFHQIHLADGYVKVLGKGSRERLVPIGKKAIEALTRYLAKAERTPTSQEPVFISQKNNRLSKSSFWRRFKKAAKQAGLPQSTHPHLLRHSFALTMLKGGTDLRSLQLLLGHASLSSTEKYLHLSPDALKETCRRAHPRF